MINIDSDFLELIGLDKYELYDLFLSSKNEDDFIKKLEINKCVDQISYPKSAFFNRQDVDQIKRELILETIKQCEDIYYYFTQGVEDLEDFMIMIPKEIKMKKRIKKKN